MDTDNYVCKCAFATLVSIIYVLHKIVFVYILCVFDHVRDKELREKKIRSIIVADLYFVVHIFMK